MKLGMGLYRHMLNRDNYRFARQCGATHLVIHLVDYFRGHPDNPTGDQPTGGDRGWGLAGDPDRLWTVEEIVRVRDEAAAEGLTLEAIENFDPAHWHDVLLDGPQRDAHIENVKTLIRRVGESGTPIFGYNFSIAGVCGRVTGPYARGSATSVGMDGPYDKPMPLGMAWNMTVDPAAPQGDAPAATHDELWGRFQRFLDEVMPVAEESGVRLALHPDDPPMEFMRGQPRLVHRPELYQRVIDMRPSPSNQLEFCVGTIAEMPDSDVYDATERYAAQGKIGYVHLRNIAGKAPHYHETFVDDGEVDVPRVLSLLHRNHFQGVIIPDHAPQMTCDAPWHAGMAYAMGYLRAAIDAVLAESAEPSLA
ncbi:Mannonate dehydratase [Pseudobythopirellula maris]|uniref:mannonate dehydratase n=1 Tax=Pseudobythopirellula maris TaxID=2527991 RepID=A0A5C5ZRR0_9BACT|nr:mannonate dehydratase [Pseudobythopirellula maris]TWT90199.1 Mannonate dehydratase [Pseudobythopirellula maris]